MIGRSYERLLERMIADGYLRTPHLIDAFKRTDRMRFVPPELRAYAYEDRPLPIGEGQTISQPSTVAFMLELLAPLEGERVLDIGSGSGWTTALLCRVVGEAGSVTGLERVDTLVRMGRINLARCGCLANCRIEKAGDALGKPGETFHRILVNAAAERFPQSLLEQLEEDGTLVIPVGHSIVKVRKRPGGSFVSERYDGFAFVPLIED